MPVRFYLFRNPEYFSVKILRGYIVALFDNKFSAIKNTKASQYGLIGVFNKDDEILFNKDRDKHKQTDIVIIHKGFKTIGSISVFD